MDTPDRDRPGARMAAEALRHLARLDPAAALRMDVSLLAAQPLGPAPYTDPEALLLADAQRFTRAPGLVAAIERARGEWRMLLLAGCVLAALTGAGLVATAGLVTGSGVLNVYAVLVMLVGLNGISLAGWLLSLLFARRLTPSAAMPSASAGIAGEGWLRRLGFSGEGLAARLAVLDASFGRHLQPWAAATLVHAFWALALSVAAIVLALRLAVEQVDFIWETTLLSPAHFQWLTAALGEAPGQLGFQTPKPEQIALTAGGVHAAVDDEAAIAARRAWAGWLIGCTLVWGLLPRLLALGVCLFVWRGRSRRHRLPLSHPFWLHRLQRLAPGGHPLAQPPVPSRANAASPPPPPPREAALGQPAGRLVGLESDDVFALPPTLPAGWSLLDGSPGDAASAATGAGDHTRLIVLANLIHAPDRGLRRRLAEIAHAWPGTVELALVGADRALHRLGSPDALTARAVDWAAAAQEAGLVDCWRLAASPADRDDGPFAMAAAAAPTADAPDTNSAGAQAATPLAPDTPPAGRHS